MKLDGVGSMTIAERLNQDLSAWKRKNGWWKSYVHKILGNRVLIGEYQPHLKVDGVRSPVGEPIKNYFPQVVPDETFFAVQRILEGNKNKGGRKDKCNNLFTFLVKCAYCGGPMSYKGKCSKSYPLYFSSTSSFSFRLLIAGSATFSL